MATQQGIKISEHRSHLICLCPWNAQFFLSHFVQSLQYTNVNTKILHADTPAINFHWLPRYMKTFSRKKTLEHTRSSQVSDHYEKTTLCVKLFRRKELRNHRMINFSSLFVPRNCETPRTTTGYTDRPNIDNVNTTNQLLIFFTRLFIYESYCTGRASCTMGTGSFPGAKCSRGVLLTTHPLLVPRSWKSRAIPLPTLWVTPGL